MPKLAEDVKRLARLANPETEASTLEVLGRDQFVDALQDADMRLWIRQARPQSLQAALEAYQLANQRQHKAVRGAYLLDGARTESTAVQCQRGKPFQRRPVAGVAGRTPASYYNFCSPQ